MRRIIKTIPLFILIFVMLFTVGCKNAIKRDEAKAYINDFLDAVEADDYEQESSLLHPEMSIDLKAYFEKMEIELVRNDKGYGIYSIEIDE